MNKDSVFRQLVFNAIDFLDQGIEDLEKRPKYTAIHFCAAIELFLKARLLTEHWTLVITDPARADIEKFSKGDFHSVSLDEAASRLAKIVREPLKAHEFQCFSKLRNERNRFVHFIDSSRENDKLRYEVAFLGLQAWHYIFRRLTKNWANEFGGFVKNLSALDQRVKRMSRVAEAKFATVKPEIEEDKKKGIEYQSCELCRFESAKITPKIKNLFAVECAVCERGWPRHLLREKCLCGSEVDYEEISQECEDCGAVITFESLVEKYSPRYDPRDEEDPVYHCGECEQKAVVPWGSDNWLCVHCLYLHDEVSHCGHCNEGITGSNESTSLSGCFLCDGPEWRD